MSGRKLAFVSAAVCEAVVDPGDVVNRMEEVFHWLAEGSIIAAKPSAKARAEQFRLPPTA